MIDDTIDDDKTIADGGEDAILAGRYRILPQLIKTHGCGTATDIFM